jgi:hypothetical protein
LLPKLSFLHREGGVRAHCSFFQDSNANVNNCNINYFSGWMINIFVTTQVDGMVAELACESPAFGAPLLRGIRGDLSII